MAGAGSSSAIERMRRHREEMELAIAENLSLGEARQRLAERRHRVRQAALDALMETPPTSGARWPGDAARQTERRPFWWEERRDDD